MSLLDLVFICDCTGSMSSYIESAKKNINLIVQGIVAAEKCDVQFALIKYRDHPPQDSTFVTDVKPFTRSPSTMRQYVETMSAAGGGDGPEAVADALHEALNLDYRKGAAKVAIIIADAPPHGLEPTGDGFPDGSPNGHDPILVAKSMAERDIAIYSVLCEPAINTFMYARDFFIAISKITGGEYLPLTSAHLLPQVVVGGAIELISLQRVQEDVERQAREEQQKAAAAGQKVNEDQLIEKMERVLKEKKVQTNQIALNEFYSPSYSMSNCNALEHATSGLREVKQALKPHTTPVYASSSVLTTEQRCESSRAEVSSHQVSKMAKKTMHKYSMY
eukprot:TRINITY_DN13902_c0_g1_i1.p1 TRINITY_DN13902_c0_g1~~TRINITY_DN13902_c0_g1_i1.p1  ORF type:complete len:334 (+),score=65.59 TRINITY_DN13902_c0_g1_i1:131-1132(+)